MKFNFDFVAISLFTTLILTVAGWITHIINCLITGKYILLIAGGIVVPVGVIHGWGLWLGINW